MATIDVGSGAPRSWQDALAVADCGDKKYVVSSPNMTFIPRPSIGIVDVVLCSDYQYGVVDPIQWPQIFTEEFEYLCAILRRVPSYHLYGPLWWSPSQTDFTRIEGAMFATLGLLNPTCLSPLLQLVDFLAELVHARGCPDDHLLRLKISMQNAACRLLHFPCTFRDATMQVRETQRYCLMVRAFMDYADISKPAQKFGDRKVNLDLMGAFTSDPNTVQLLFAAGVPVWFIRTDVSMLTDPKVGMAVLMTNPDDICVQPGPEGGHILYHGLSGEKHLRCTAQGGHTYLDISRAPLIAVVCDRGYPPPISQKRFIGYHASEGKNISSAAPSRAKSGTTGAIRTDRRITAQRVGKNTPHPSQVRGVNKFLYFEHCWMPRSISSWATAMASIDLCSPARPNGEIWGYWIPEPALLLRPTTTERRDRYIMTWLRLRPGWLYMLRLSDFRPTSIPTQWWRDVLYGPTGRDRDNDATLNAQRARSVEDIFGPVLGAANMDVALSTPVRWFGTLIREVSADVAPKIIWEMHDLAFRYELQALDRLLVPSCSDEVMRDALLADIFPNRMLYSLPDRLPDEMAFYSALPHQRTYSLEAFRLVLSRWPRCPLEIREAVPLSTSMSAEDIVRREEEMAIFYVHTFFEHSGRAPIVPHRPPAW